MNRQTLRRLAEIRRREAAVLLSNKLYGGAYYLSGYVVECALKACIASQTRRADFPDRELAIASHTHNLAALLKVAGLQVRLQAEARADAQFSDCWDTVTTWKPESRYAEITAQQATALYDAVNDPAHEVYRWVKQFW